MDTETGYGTMTAEAGEWKLWLNAGDGTGTPDAVWGSEDEARLSLAVMGLWTPSVERFRTIDVYRVEKVSREDFADI